MTTRMVSRLIWGVLCAMTLLHFAKDLAMAEVVIAETKEIVMEAKLGMYKRSLATDCFMDISTMTEDCVEAARNTPMPTAEEWKRIESESREQQRLAKAELEAMGYDVPETGR